MSKVNCCFTLPCLFLLLSGCGGEPPAIAQHVPKIYAVEQQEVAVAALREGDDAAALAATDRAIEHDPDYPEPYAIKAGILARRGEFDAARALLDTALAKRPDFVEGHLVRGAILEEMKQHDAARSDFTIAASGYATLAQGKPGDPVLALKHALAEYLRGSTDGLRAINTIVSRFPDFQSGRFVKERMDAGDRAFAFRWITGHATAAADAAPMKKD